MIPYIWQGENHDSHIRFFRELELAPRSIHRLSELGIEANKVYKDGNVQIYYTKIHGNSKKRKRTLF